MVGASQGGILACEYALTNARNGVSVKLVLLSTSPSAHQLDEIKTFIGRDVIEIVATVGNEEGYFGGIEAWLDYSNGSGVILTAITRRINDMGGTVISFEGRHCCEQMNTFEAIRDVLVV